MPPEAKVARAALGRRRGNAHDVRAPRLEIPSIALNERSFNSGFAMWRCGCGPSWDEHELAARPGDAGARLHERCGGVIGSLELAVDRHGYREYDNPHTGRGLAARGFGFSPLLIDLLAQCGNDIDELSAAGPIMAP